MYIQHKQIWYDMPYFGEITSGCTIELILTKSVSFSAPTDIYGVAHANTAEDI